jgi:hypothetical protein
MQIKHNGERLFTRSLAIALRVRDSGRAWGVILLRRFNGYDFTRANVSEIFLQGG